MFLVKGERIFQNGENDQQYKCCWKIKQDGDWELSIELRTGKSLLRVWDYEQS